MVLVWRKSLRKSTPRTQKHIFSGHAVARALRAYMLVPSALINHINNTLIDEGKLNASELEDIYNKAMQEGIKKDKLV